MRRLKTAWLPILAGSVALALVVLFFTDYDHQLLPDAVTLTVFGVGLAAAWFNPFLDGEGWHRIWTSFAGAALGSGLLWGVGALYRKIRVVDAMGMGDVKMMAMIGAYLGPVGAVLTIFLGALAGSVIFGPISLKTGKMVPFGVFLALGAAVTFLLGDALIDWYRGAFLAG